MHLEVTAEVLIKQLGLEPNESLLQKAQKVIDNTKGYEEFANHIISLNDFLKHVNGYIDFSNSYDYLKIIEEEASQEITDEFEDKVKAWADKYHIELEFVQKDTKAVHRTVYYIKGKI
jgi:hypothetical protein